MNLTEQITAKPLSKVEQVKTQSEGLAGTIGETLVSEATHFDENDLQLLKFHGSYQQDDRDLRTERRKLKLDKAWMFMVRCKIPGGRMTARQYLALDEYARAWGNGTLRITSRQGIQFHGVGKQHLKHIIHGINDVRLSTLGACGDVNRNVMCCPVSDLDARAHLLMEQLCMRVADHLAPKSTAYWEIWCDGEKWGQRLERSRSETIYQDRYLPRKFKIAVATPEDNCVDLYANDIGVEAVHEHGRLLAWDLSVGGGMGYSHGQEKTYPKLAIRMVRVEPDRVLEAIEAIVTIQRDFGDRTDRRHARLKYTLEDMGLDQFRAELHRRLGRELPDAGPQPHYTVHDHLGWHETNRGTLMLGIHIDNGRIADGDSGALSTGLREIIRRFELEVRTTPRQDIILAGIRPQDQSAVDHLLNEFGLKTDRDILRMRRLAMACPALPTCGLALAESERYLPSLLDELERRGIGDAPVEIRMTGCPNSCVRTPSAEIGIAGRGPGKYAMVLGGNQEGTRLAFLFKETVEEARLAPIIQQLIVAWEQQTNRSTPFGDWAVQRGSAALDELIQF